MKRTHVYISVPVKQGWKWFEQMQHNAFYGGVSDGWGPSFINLAKKMSRDYTDHHNSLRSMNRCQPAQYKETT